MKALLYQLKEKFLLIFHVDQDETEGKEPINYKPSVSESKELFHSCFKNISARTEILQVRASINLVLFHLSDKHLQRSFWCWQCDRIGDTVIISKAHGACLMELTV